MNITDKIMDLSLIWKQAATVFPYFGKRSINWDEAYREYLGRAMTTQTDREHYLLLAEFINLLGDGHTDLIFPKALLDEMGYVPFDFVCINGQYFLDGYPVNHVNGVPIEELVALAGRYVYHVGNYVPRFKQILPLLMDSKELVVGTEKETLHFSLSPQRSEPRKPGDAVFVEYGDVLFVRLDDFLRDRAAEIREKLAERAPRAVILDIRNNIGGMTKYGAEIASLFLSGKFQGCRKRTRVMRGNDIGPASQIARMSEPSLNKLIGDGFTTREEIEVSMQVYRNAYCEEYEDDWGRLDNKALFNGPCVLLTSRNTISAAEDFAAFFRTNHRAHLIGMPTCGTTGTPLVQPLSAGYARICTVGYQLLDGTEFIGKGIEPDIYLEPNVTEIRQGKDAVLERALEYLR